MPSAPCEYQDSAKLEPERDFFARLVRQGGPEPTDYAAFQSWLEQMAKALGFGSAVAEEVRSLWATGGLATVSRLTLQGFVRVKPNGYSGDFELIDRIYQTWISSDPSLEKWDRFFQAQAAPCALRYRKDYFQTWLREGESRLPAFPPRLHLLHLGGGPGRELRDYFLATPESRVAATYLDPDARAIGYAAGICVPIRARVTFQQANPLGFQPAVVPHLIWSAGLFDYLDDENGISLLRRLWRLILPGGELVAANFAPHNPTRAYMELSGWVLNYRDAAHLWKLARQAGVPESAIKIGRGPGGADLFLHLRKTQF